MQPLSTSADAATRRHRPKTLTVFAAAFAAGAVLAYGVDRVVDVHVVRVEPQVESEPIFVALRSLPQGAPVTVWDVALKDWPKAMLPTTALRADSSFEGMVLRLPVREGQPLLSVQLVRDGAALPGTTVAALPAGATPVATPWVAAEPAAPAPAPTATTTPAAAPSERFVPATPAEPAVVSVPAAGADTVAPTPAAVTSGVDAAPPVTDEIGAAPASTVATTDTGSITDIDPVIASVTEPAIEQVPAAAETAAARVEEPTVVAVVESPATVDPTAVLGLGAGDATAAPVAEVAAAPGPLVAPVPSLPTTDIEQTLADFGRQAASTRESTDRIASVLDRSIAEPAPAPTASTPKHHLVIPERVALAADAAFTERPQPTPMAEPAPETTAGTTQPARSLAEGGGAPASVGGRQPQATNGGRKKPVSAASRRASSPAWQSASPKAAGMKPVQRSAAQPPAKPATKPQPTPAQGLSAWFQNLSGGSRQR